MHDSDTYDLAIIGGGINGTGIAADAAGRGLKVILAEAGDLGGATSSASSKLIHGGLRYLEHLELRLVREALAEREVLLAMAPHIVRPLRFVLPHMAGMRPRALLRAGLLLYDHLSRRRTIKPSRRLDLTTDVAGAALDPGLRAGFEYWDCWVDDARLVVLNARMAADRGARILTRSRVAGARAQDGRWALSVATPAGPAMVSARVLVNAAGPWAGVLGEHIEGASRPRLRLVKGSHIVVERRWPGDQAYLLQSPDRRVVFALPFEGRFTLIGTTDEPFSGDPAGVAASAEEERYLIAAANRFLARPLRSDDVVWWFAGVRPLYDDAAADASRVTRDYRLELAADAGRPALLSVLGGKITTYRRLAESALALLSPHLPPHGPAWTHATTLPGGDLGPRGLAGLIDDLTDRWPALERAYLTRLAHRYGSEAPVILGDARRPQDLGYRLGALLSEREVHHLKAREWATTPEDVLWRRTKAGLHLAAADREEAEQMVARML